jgi:hypothetical protein
MAPETVALVRGVVQLNSNRAVRNPAMAHSMVSRPAPVATSTVPGVLVSHDPLSFLAVHFAPARSSGHLCSLEPGKAGVLATQLTAAMCSRW